MNQRSRWLLVVTGAALLATVALLLVVRPRPKSLPEGPPVPGERRPEGLALATAGSRPDLVLITIDTLRADHVGAYGYQRPTTPTLDTLARRGTRYTRAWSTSSWTLPAMTSMITGTWPLTHGLVVAERDAQPALHPDLPNLPQTLQNLGYRTYGLTANGHLNGRFGFDRGFDRYAARGFSIRRLVRPVLQQFAADLQEGPPFFLWLHVFDPHGPYLRQSTFEQFAPTAGVRVLQEDDLRAARAEGTLTHAMLDEVVAAYDSEIRHDDDLIAELFTWLPRAAEAFIVVAADHGEMFDDHGDFGHPERLYDELTRIPLIVVDPADPRARVSDRPSSLIDVFPTLVAAAGAPPVDTPGVDLRTAVDPERPVFLDVQRSTARRGVVRGRWKLLVDDRDPAGQRLFDLQTDPREQEDLASRRPDVVAALGRLLQEHARLPAVGPGPLVPPDSDHVERLRALGYLDD